MAFPLDPGRMAHVQTGTSMDGESPVRGRGAGQPAAVPGVGGAKAAGRGPVGTGRRPELARAFVGAGDRDPIRRGPCNSATSAARGCNLVPRQAREMPFDDADGLDERLDLVAALVPQHVPVARERGEAKEPGRPPAGPCWRLPLDRWQAYLPLLAVVVVADEEVCHRRGNGGRAASTSVETCAIRSVVKT